MGRVQAPAASPDGMGRAGKQLGSFGVSEESSPALLALGSTAGLHCRTTQDEGLRGPARIWGFPGGARGKESTCQCRSFKRLRFDPWAWKIPWRRVWQPTLVIKLGKFHGQRSLAGYSPWVHKDSDTAEASWHTHIPSYWIFLSAYHQVYLKRFFLSLPINFHS